MARADAHTRIVGWLKVALPLMALAILSSLFLLSNRINPDDALPFAEVDVEARAREPRMTAPTYAGTTSDGAAITLAADEARPATEGAEAGAVGLRLELDTPDGARTELVAANGILDPETKQIVLGGGVTITTATGYRVETAELVAKLDRSGLESRAPVTATGPAGEIRADKVTLQGDAQTPGSYLLVFKGGVRLVYQPGG